MKVAEKIIIQIGEYIIRTWISKSYTISNRDDSKRSTHMKTHPLRTSQQTRGHVSLGGFSYEWIVWSRPC